MEQLKEQSSNKPLKKLKGYSNGSLVDCYISIDEDRVTVYRPNPNAKEVYNRMEIKESREFRENHWHI